MNINIIKKSNVLLLLALWGMAFEKSSCGVFAKMGQAVKNNKVATGTLATFLALLLGGAYTQYGASTPEEVQKKVEELKKEAAEDKEEAQILTDEAQQKNNEAKIKEMVANTLSERAQEMAFSLGGM